MEAISQEGKKESNQNDTKTKSYEMCLKECGLTTLETRRLRVDQIEVFKILNGNENIERNMFFSVKEERTRGHELHQQRSSVD